VDYIIIIIADVDVDVNPNEVRDTKYVSPEELKEMFKQPGTASIRCAFLMIRPSVYAMVQTDLSTIFVQVVGESR
jgi:isopentenyldiphosphate isomerase